MELQTVMSPKASLEAQKRLRELYGLDKPLHVQYWDWLKRVALLDFGLSFSPDWRPVWDKIKERLGITISLNLMALTLILLTAIPIGVLSAVRPHSWFDRATTLLVFFGFAMPTFWLALLLIILMVAVPLGVLAAYRAHSWFDKATTLLVYFGFAMPNFWLYLAPMLIAAATRRARAISARPPSTSPPASPHVS